MKIGEQIWNEFFKTNVFGTTCLFVGCDGHGRSGLWMQDMDQIAASGRAILSIAAGMDARQRDAGGNSLGENAEHEFCGKHWIGGCEAADSDASGSCVSDWEPHQIIYRIGHRRT